MKTKLTTSVLLALSICLLSATAIAGDGDFITRTIRATDQALTVNIPDRRFVRIANFVQDVQTARNTEQPGGPFIIESFTGTVTLSQNNAAPVAIMYASLASQSEAQKDFFIAGPAVMRIDPVPSANLVITYRIGKD